MAKHKPKMIGWRERISLPELGLERIEAKIDTGARTTALHAVDIAVGEYDGRRWVEFTPDHGALSNPAPVAAPLLHLREITNTSGVPERRYIIISELRLGGRAARIEVSLTDRADMKFPIIVGRTALRQLRLIIDPSRSWLGKPMKKIKGKDAK